MTPPAYHFDPSCVRVMAQAPHVHAHYVSIEKGITELCCHGCGVGLMIHHAPTSNRSEEEATVLIDFRRRFVAAHTPCTPADVATWRSACPADRTRTRAVRLRRNPSDPAGVDAPPISASAMAIVIQMPLGRTTLIADGDAPLVDVLVLCDACGCVRVEPAQEIADTIWPSADWAIRAPGICQLIYDALLFGYSTFMLDWVFTCAACNSLRQTIRTTGAHALVRGGGDGTSATRH